jgi:replicative DNA helicase
MVPDSGQSSNAPAFADMAIRSGAGEMVPVIHGESLGGIATHGPVYHEQMVLGTLLRRPIAYDQVSRVVSEQDFQVHAHRMLYRAIGDLVAQGQTPDLVMIHAQAERISPGDCDARLIALLYDSFVAFGNLDYHAKRVRDRGILAQLLAAGKEIIALAEKPHGSAGEMVSHAGSLIEAIEARGVHREPSPISEAICRAMEAIDRRSCEPERRGWRSGIAALDGILGGFRPGELTTIAARPAVGKTSFVLACAHAAGVQGCRVLFVSCEMAMTELAERLLSSDSGVPLRHIREARIDEQASNMLSDARKRLDPLPLYIDDEPRQSVRHIAAQARMLRRRHGLGMLIIDYLGLLKMSSGRGMPRHEAVAEATRDLKVIARELDVPVLLLAQLNRQVEGRGGEPRLSDLRESGAIEQDSDNVIFLHRPDESEPGNTLRQNLKVIVAKQRNGPTGDILVPFLRAKMRFGTEPDAKSFDDARRNV